MQNTPEIVVIGLTVALICLAGIVSTLLTGLKVATKTPQVEDIKKNEDH